MSDIKFIILSDLHLGQDQSLLTHLDGANIDPLSPSPVLLQLRDALKTLVTKPYTIYLCQSNVIV